MVNKTGKSTIKICRFEIIDGVKCVSEGTSRVCGRYLTLASMCFLLLLLGFFFLIMKVFHFQRKTNCYCIVSFSLLLFFFFRTFVQRISPKLIEFYEKKKLFWWRHFRSRTMADFVIFGRSFCPDIISETTKDRMFKLTGLIDKRLNMCTVGFKCF